MIQPAYSFGMASAAYVGQNLGARKMDRIQAGVRKSVVICIVICVALGLVEIFVWRIFGANFLFPGKRR